MIYFLALGFVFGLKHAFEADHVAAVAVLASREQNAAKRWQYGLYWGMGHTITLLAIGLLVLMLGIVISEKLSAFFELCVAVMVMGFGVFTLGMLTHRHPPSGTHAHVYKPFAVGMLHGLAGSAAILALIVSAIQSALLGLAYILFFGIGSIIGMVCLSVLVGISATRFKTTANVAVGIFGTLTGFVLLIKTLPSVHLF